MNFLICDDEREFALSLKERLEILLEQMHQSAKIECVFDENEMKHIEKNAYDIVFLDIDMGELNGLDLAKKIRKAQPDVILVFITHYVQYSLEGYEVKALRYLLKSNLDEKLPECLQAALAAYKKERRVIRLSSGSEEVDLMPAHITYAETQQRHLCLHLIHDKRDTCDVRMTMNALEELLSPHGFLRIHQSFLVNMAYIKTMKSTGVCLTDDTQLAISTRNYSKLKQEYLRWRGMKRWSMQSI